MGVGSSLAESLPVLARFEAGCACFESTSVWGLLAEALVLSIEVTPPVDLTPSILLSAACLNSTGSEASSLTARNDVLPPLCLEFPSVVAGVWLEDTFDAPLPDVPLSLSFEG